MGLFGKLKAVLSKTRDGLKNKLANLFSRGLSDDFYEELEDILISSDVSVSTATEIVDEIRETAKKDKLKDEAYVLPQFRKNARIKITLRGF